MSKRIHVAMSVDADRFSDTYIRKHILPAITPTFEHPELFRRGCWCFHPATMSTRAGIVWGTRRRTNPMAELTRDWADECSTSFGRVVGRVVVPIRVSVRTAIDGSALRILNRMHGWADGVAPLDVAATADHQRAAATLLCQETIMVEVRFTRSGEKTYSILEPANATEGSRDVG